MQRSGLLLVFTAAHVTALLSNVVAITVRAMDGDRWKPPLAVMCLDEASHRSCLALFRQVSRASLPVACVEPAVASALFNTTPPAASDKVVHGSERFQTIQRAKVLALDAVVDAARVDVLLLDLDVCLELNPLPYLRRLATARHDVAVVVQDGHM